MEEGREGGNKGHLPFSFKQTSTIVLYFQILHLEKKSAKENERGILGQMNGPTLLPDVMTRQFDSDRARVLKTEEEQGCGFQVRIAAWRGRDIE